MLKVCETLSWLIVILYPVVTKSGLVIESRRLTLLFSVSGSIRTRNEGTPVPTHSVSIPRFWASQYLTILIVPAQICFYSSFLDAIGKALFVSSFHPYSAS